MFYVSFCFACLAVADPGFPRYQFLGINSRNPSDGVDHNLINGRKVNVGLTGEALNYYNLSIWDKLHNISMVTKGHRDICFKIEKQNGHVPNASCPEGNSRNFCLSPMLWETSVLHSSRGTTWCRKNHKIGTSCTLPSRTVSNYYRAHGPHYQTTSSLLQSRDVKYLSSPTKLELWSSRIRTFAFTPEPRLHLSKPLATAQRRSKLSKDAFAGLHIPRHRTFL